MRNAELNLGYTTITSPVTGVTAPGVAARRLARAGAADHPHDHHAARSRLRQLLVHRLRAARVPRAEWQPRQPIGDETSRSSCSTATARRYPGTGKMDASQNVDAQTGTIQTRAIFANQDGVAAARTVRAHGHQGRHAAECHRHPAGRRSRRARRARSSTSWTRTARRRCAPVQLDREVNSDWVVRDGLKDGDTVIVDGVMRVRPGAPVPRRAPKQAGQPARSRGRMKEPASAKK